MLKFLSLRDKSAPASNNNSAISLYCFCCGLFNNENISLSCIFAASNSAVLKFLSLWDKSAPAFNNNIAISLSCMITAFMSGVCPSSSTLLTSAPFSIKSSATLKAPAFDAVSNGVSLKFLGEIQFAFSCAEGVFISRKAPFSINNSAISFKSNLAATCKGESPK